MQSDQTHIEEVNIMPYTDYIAKLIGLKDAKIKNRADRAIQ